MNEKVIIVGGGIIGLFSAYYAAKEGFDVTVLDRETETHNGCSTGNAGMIVPSHFTPLATPGMVGYGLRQMFKSSSPFGIRPNLAFLRWGLIFAAACNTHQANAAKPILAKLNLMSSQEYDRLEGEIGGFGLTRRGLVMLCQTKSALDEESHLAREAPQFGMEAHVLGRREVEQMDPTIEMDVLGGVYFPSDGHLSPLELVAAVRTKLRKIGVCFRFDQEVTTVKMDRRRVTEVGTLTETYEADQVVVASGRWSEGLAAKLNLRLPLMAGKGYSFDIASPAQIPTLCSILVEGRVAVTPMLHGLRVAGTMELGAEDSRINQNRVLGIRAALSRYFPKLTHDSAAPFDVWTGLRPCSPDGMPYLGRSTRYDNLIVATGHSMMGLSLAPITGRIVADLLLNRPFPLDLSLLSVDRYA